ncbi:MAG: ABC transporter ATP-binding protein [Pirellulales bacterium]
MSQSASGRNSPPRGRGVWRELCRIGKRGRQVWALVPRRYHVMLGSAALIMALTSAANTAAALLLGRIIDQLRTGVDQAARASVMAHTLIILAVLAGVYVSREVLHVVRRALVERSVTSINRDMQVRMVEHAMHLDLERLAGEKVGALHGRIFRSVDGFVRYIRIMFLDCLPAFTTGLIALAAAVFKSPLLGLIMLGVVPLAFYLTIRQLKSQKGVRMKLMRTCETLDGMVVEQLHGVEYIRAAHTGAREVKRLRKAADKRREREVKHHFEMSLFGCGKALNEAFFHILVLGVASYYAVQGDISYGDVLAMSVLYLNVMAPLNEIHRVLDEGHEASLRVGDLVNFLNLKEDISFHGDGVIRLTGEEVEPLIRIQDLVVSYQTAEGKYKRALDRVSLDIRHGETIGVAGPSGAGKSTWVKVLLRLLHPLEGDVFLNGVPLDIIGRKELAKTIGYVGQNPFVFSGTIAQNIAYGNGKRSREEIQRAAELANLHDDVLEMADGYDTRVTERGQNLSGGQRQRIALVADPPQKPVDPDLRRSDQRARQHLGTSRATIACGDEQGSHDDFDRSSPNDAQGLRPHPGLRGRSHRRVRHLCGTDRFGRRLQRVGRFGQSGRGRRQPRVAAAAGNGRRSIIDKFADDPTHGPIFGHASNTSG